MGDVWDIEEASSWNVSNTQCPSTKYSVTKCSSTQILGGYKCLASNAQISRSFTLPHHWSIYIKVSFWLIDSWDSESLIMKLGNITITELRDHSPQDFDLCGAKTNWWGLNAAAYLDRKYDKTIENNPHYERSVTAIFTSDLNGTADDESFGINNFQLLIDPCNPTCDKCLLGPESFNCLSCWANATFVKYVDDYFLCTCSPTEFYYAKKGSSCTKNCPQTHTQQGFCKCNDGYYTVSKDVPCSDPICTECKQCDSTCKLCSGPGPASCITCAANLYKQLYTSPDISATDPKFGKTLCVPNCLNSSYYIDQVKKECSKCDSSCKTCNGSLSAECTSCPNGQYLDGTDIGGGLFVGFCVSQCSQGYYKNNTTKRCMRCNPNCIYCKDDLPDYCTECKTKLHWKDGICYSSCPDGYWNDTPYKLCKQCDPKCNTCLGSATFCTSCIGNYYYYLKQNDCLNNTCPVGMYKFKNTSTGFNSCQICDNTCLTCSGGTFNDCLSCDPAIGFLRGSTCTACSSNQYGNTQNQTCQPCHSSCATCEGPNSDQCRSCSGSLLFYQKKCINTCPDSTYPDSMNNLCASCDPTCATCMLGGSDKCKTCSTGRFLTKNSCQTSCNPIGEYADTNNNVCGACNLECVSCKDGTNKGCLSCPGTKYLQANQCVDKCLSNLFGLAETRECFEKCPQGYYADTTSKLCLKCDPQCPICSAGGLANCSKCSGSLFLDGTICKTICPKGYYGELSDNSCKKCQESCQECQGGTEKDCTKCQGLQYLGGNVCYTKCPNNQYGDQVTMSCVAECPQGTYGNQLENLCKACHRNCSQCYGPSYSQCYKCNIQYQVYNLNGTCDLCPSGYYGNDLTRTCDKCFENCNECIGGSPNDCTKCTRGTFFVQEKKMCVSTCPAPFYSEDNNPNCILSCTHSNQYPNPITRRCDICNNACLECTGPYASDCKKCSPNYFFLAKETSCLKQCPYGYYSNINTFTCEPCDKSCATCNGGLSDQCLSCQEPRILYQNQCKMDCPDELFRDQDRLMCVTDCTQFKSNRFANLQSKKCQTCNSACLLCKGPSNKECSKCSQSHYLLGTECLDVCPLGYYQIYKDHSVKDTNPNTKSTNDCLKCHQNCSDCYGPSDNECRTCSKGLFFFTQPQTKDQQNTIRTCVVNCPDQYIQNKEAMTCDQCPPYTYFDKGECKNCHYSCMKCNGPTKFDCLKCSSIRSVNKEGEPAYAQCNCKSGFMESFSHDCDKVNISVQSAGKSVMVSLITSGSCSVITGLLGTSAFSFHQVIEISQFTSSLRYANITYPLNINAVFESITTDQANEAMENKRSPPTTTTSPIKRILMNKSELEYFKETGQAPQLWQKYIFTLVMNIMSWLVVLIINIFVIHLKIKFDNQRTLEKVRVMLQYTLPLQVFIRTAQEGFQFIFVSFYFSSSLDFFGWLNCVYMTLTALAVFGIIIKSSFLNVEKKEKKSLDDQEEYILTVKTKKQQNLEYPHPLRTLWYFFKDNKISRNYYSLMLSLKFLYIFVFVFSSSVQAQMISMVISKMIFLIYLIIVKPFKYKWYNYINIFNESLSAVIPLTVLIMSASSEDKYQTFGWLIMMEMIILFLVNFVYSVIELVLMLKRIITKNMNKTKKFIQVNQEKQDQSIDNQSILFEKSVVKNIQRIPLREDLEKGISYEQDSKEQSKLSMKNTQLQVIQIGQSNQVLQSSNQGLKGTSDYVYDESDQIEEYQFQSPLKNSTKREDEDFNLNSSSIKNQSMMKDESYQLNESYEMGGFPLQVFGKQLEEVQLNSPQKRKKKNKRKDANSQSINQQDCGSNISSNFKNESNNYENQTSQAEKESQLNSAKLKQKLQEEEEQKQKNISQMIENVTSKIQKLNDSNNVSPRKIPERTQLDIIQIIEQQSSSQVKRLIGSPSRIKKQKLSRESSREQLDDLSNIYKQDQMSQSGLSIVKGHSYLNKITEDKQELNSQETQITEISKIQSQKQGSSQHNSFNPSQKIKGDKEIQIQQQNKQEKINKNEKRKKYQNKGNQNSSQQTQQSNISDQQTISNFQGSRQEIDSDKKSEISPRKVKINEESNQVRLFEGQGEFRIQRVALERSNSSSPEKIQKSKIESIQEDDKSKSIVEYIKNKAKKAKEQKQQNSNN